ncbi:substrate-binding domain-containing protein [Akkermansiaceae bacterium]|nr:substrate-binding domain-containing protein [Akkermansiaceae bacterium]
MAKKALCTFTDQVTDQLRRGMAEGRWRKTLPGRKKLADELGCSQWTVEEAVERLTKEGMLVSPGPGKRRQITLREGVAKPRVLRIVILLYEEAEKSVSYHVNLLHRLQDAGHEVVFAEKSLHDLKMNTKRVARFVGATEADAWVVVSASRDVLQWFAGQDTPAFALFGRSSRVSLPSAALRKSDALIELADRLVDLGHHRIVILAREERRKPNPAYLEQLFLDRLEERGISTGPYNLPDWGDSPKELRRILDSLFMHTPPSALIVDQPVLCVAVLQHLSRIGLSAPDDVSLACTDWIESFDWCDPEVTHITWDARPVINQVVRWAERISRGKDDRRKHNEKVRLVLGGTIGAAPR